MIAVRTLATGVALAAAVYLVPTSALSAESPEPDAVLMDLLDALERVRSGTDALEAAGERMERELREAGAELEALGGEIEDIGKSIEERLADQAGLRKRLRALEQARLLLERWDGGSGNEAEAPRAPVEPSAEAKRASAGDSLFEREVYPLLESRCLHCHGPQTQKAQLRLDSKAIVFEGGLSGPAVTPGDPDGSLIVQRIEGDEHGPRMPLNADPLSGDEIGIIRDWIAGGAEWPAGVGVDVAEVSKHWSFEKPVRPEVPQVSNPDWVRNPIDAFILARLEDAGLKPSPQAPWQTLFRRVHLDITGLPPSPGALDRFMAQPGEEALQTVINGLFESPHYGEKWAIPWLDAARYADTNGYEKDRPRSMWPYRDWVINALNADMPFDQFAIEQIAGDMLPNAKPDQIVATGFHRNTMLNEEGGVDVEEFRFESMVDRVGTTGTVFLGLTVACAQCHNHKYDPISQKEYYQLFAFLNNADEVELAIEDPEITAKREAIKRDIAALEGGLENRFPAFDRRWAWEPLVPLNHVSLTGAVLSVDENFIQAAGPALKTDTHIVSAYTEAPEIEGFRIRFKEEAAAKGMEFNAVTLSAFGPDGKGGEAALESAEDEFGGTLYRLAAPLNAEKGVQLVFQLSYKDLEAPPGAYAIEAGDLRRPPEPPGADLTAQRAERLDRMFSEWKVRMAARSREWEILRPANLNAGNHTTLTPLEDGSILAEGDNPNNDVYTVDFPAPRRPITALRLETLEDPSLPGGGPGRGVILGDGNFMLSEISLLALDIHGASEPREIPIASISADSGKPNSGPENAIDGDRGTGWSVDLSKSPPYNAVLVPAEPIELAGNQWLRVTLDQNFIHNHTIGRFRLSAAFEGNDIVSSGLPAEIEAWLLETSPKRADERERALRRHFLLTTPELAAAQEEIRQRRNSMPPYATTLAMDEREGRPRETRIHHRGEYLQPGPTVKPGVPKVLHPLPGDAPRNRLAFARWLASEENPLLARVVMNRLWHGYFGRGIVETLDDFGTRGAKPTHPDLLDWLAVEFMESGWSLKHMHRLIVDSAVYRQSSAVTPGLMEADPNNEMYARGARFRLPAELVRDAALAAGGLLTRTVGGESVYPPLPPGLGELSYGALSWPTDTGENRFRRGLYTFLKRTNPHPMLTAFDATSRETACVMRNRSNTPLQALTLLNGQTFVEASKALGRRVLAEAPDSTAGRVERLFKLCLSREPGPEETTAVAAFVEKQLRRMEAGELDAEPIARDASDPDLGPIDHRRHTLNEVAAWTAAARAVLNLDETITRE